MKRLQHQSLKRSRGFVASDFAGQVLSRLVFSRRSRERASDRAIVDAAVPSLSERKRNLIDFHEVYEQLVEALCDAAHYGVTQDLDRSFCEARARMQSTYPGLRPFLISYLEFVPEDAETGLKLCGRPLDAFEALTACFDLQEFFLMDDGNMISRLTRTRDALNLYGQHLRLLGEKVG